MHVEIKPGRSRTFNGLRIINPDRRRSIRLIVEPAKRVVEAQDQGHTAGHRVVDPGDESGE